MKIETRIPSISEREPKRGYFDRDRITRHINCNPAIRIFFHRQSAVSQEMILSKLEDCMSRYFKFSIDEIRNGNLIGLVYEAFVAGYLQDYLQEYQSSPSLPSSSLVLKTDYEIEKIWNDGFRKGMRDKYELTEYGGGLIFTSGHPYFVNDRHPELRVSVPDYIITEKKDGFERVVSVVEVSMKVFPQLYEGDFLRIIKPNASGINSGRYGGLVDVAKKINQLVYILKIANMGKVKNLQSIGEIIFVSRGIGSFPEGDFAKHWRSFSGMIGLNYDQIMGMKITHLTFDKLSVETLFNFASVLTSEIEFYQSKRTLGSCDRRNSS